MAPKFRNRNVKTTSGLADFWDMTEEKTDRMVNCANAECNRHFSLSEKGAKKFNGCCSKECMLSPNIRKYDGTGFYQRKMNGYNPLIGAKNKSRIN